jgi:hypothetical protein
MKTPLHAACAAALLLAGCQQVPMPASSTDAAGNTITEWPLPAGAGAAAPDLSLAPDGRLLLSWIKPFDGQRNALQFTTYDRDAKWQWAPKTIAVGASMVVNRMDTPHIAGTADGALWAHWLQKTRGAGESFDIVVSRSSDDGMNWSPPVRAHDDGKAVEHGFVSFWPAARDRLGIAWLDGRNTHGDMSNDMPGMQMQATAQATDARGGMMTLRSATMDAASRIADAVEVDDSVCDCCQTGVAMTTRGPLLVYRDRTEAEIRDIHATRMDGGAWRTPVVVHADNWKMTACPVNGPAVAADGNNAVVAWYSAANDTPMVEIARSGDAGDSFAAAVVVDKGAAVQGRVGVAVDAKQAWVAWLREDASGQSLWLARYAPDLSRELARIEVAKLQGRGRGTGVPKLVARDGEAYLVWTDLAGGTSQLHGARVKSR